MKHHCEEAQHRKERWIGGGQHGACVGFWIVMTIGYNNNRGAAGGTQQNISVGELYVYYVTEHGVSKNTSNLLLFGVLIQKV
jgi:hypothetical protein